MSFAERRFKLVLVVVALLGAALPFHAITSARGVNGAHGFPLDDPWIHLTYARNLYETGRFTYFPGDPGSQGSTAPLYTILAALGFFFTGDEKLLSYGLGLFFQLGFLVAMGVWIRRRLSSVGWALAGVALLAMDGRTLILAGSGMETTLFLCLIACAFCGLSSDRPAWTSVAVGLAVWVRPEGLILAGVIAIALVIERCWALPEPGECRPRSRTYWLRLALPGLLIIGAFMLFNLALNGTFLPNTFAAKIAYYAGRPRAVFLRETLTLITTYGWALAAPFSLGAILVTTWRLLARRPAPLAPEAGWAIGLILAYLFYLPYGHRFLRYLVPALPALAVLAMAGLAGCARWIERRRLVPSRALVTGTIVVTCIVLARQAQGVPTAVGEYAVLCKYHSIRHERAGHWLAEHTAEDAVIAAHDVGALAYYSRRRVIDILGIVLPEAIVHVHTPGYNEYLIELFDRTKVTHIAVLRNFLEIDNVPALWVADPEPEILSIFEYVKGRTHLVPPEATALRGRAISLARAGDRRARALAEHALALDRQSATSWDVVGQVAELSGRREQAALAYRNALALFPDSGPIRAHWVRVQPGGASGGRPGP